MHRRYSSQELKASAKQVRSYLASFTRIRQTQLSKHSLATSGHEDVENVNAKSGSTTGSTHGLPSIAFDKHHTARVLQLTIGRHLPKFCVCVSAP